MAKKREPGGLDSSAIGWGFVIGMLLGGIGALFKAPKRLFLNRERLAETGQSLRSKLEAVAPSDPVADSIAEGKAAAQRRRAQLGLDR